MPFAPAPDRPLAARWAQLLVGLVGWALAATLMIRAGLGLGPWDALHVGIHDLTGLGVGAASIATGLVVLLASLAVGVRPGFGTLANMVLLGAFIDLLLPLVPQAPSRAAGLAYFLGGVALGGWFTGVYVTANLGQGPRDGLVLALARRSGWPVRRVRTALELAVLAGGWAVGGPLGLGTVLFAVAIGPSMQWGLRCWGAVPAAAEPRADEVLAVRRAA